MIQRLAPAMLLGMFLVLAILIAVSPGWLVPWLTIPGLAVIDAVCLGHLLRRDRMVFASVALPPLVLALVALGLRPALAILLDLAALLWYVPFEFGGNHVWRFWQTYVLRRR